ncbi:MAG: tetratricopeptide repeat protein [Clostridia bacterium]
MLDLEDYIEPTCLLCADDERYSKGQQETIPVSHIVDRLDKALDKEDFIEAERLLKFWENEAKSLKDMRGLLSIYSEIMGLSRKINNEEWAMEAVKEGFEIIENEELQGLISTATVWLNGATTLKAFGKSKEALVYYAKAEKIYSEKLPADDDRMAGLFNNMALALVDEEDYPEAEEYYYKAIEIMLSKPNGEVDSAISYINLAQMYDKCKDKSEVLVDANLMKAYDCLNSNKVTRNGYYAFVCRKCASAFDYYGYFLIKQELNERADKIYEGN